MHWWQNAFSSSSSSSSSASKTHSDDSILVGSGKYAIKSGIFFGRNTRSRRAEIGRFRRVPGLSETEVDSFRSTNSDRPSSCSLGSPQPLPLPDLQVQLRRDGHSAPFNHNHIPLPSPRDVPLPQKGGKDRERGRLDEFIADVSHNSDGHAVGRKTGDYLETRNSGKSSKQQSRLNRIHDYKIQIPNSAPTSPYASPALSPQKFAGDFMTSQYVTPPSVFQVWSAPEMPPSDNTGLGFSYPFSSEMSSASVDNSPLGSPRTSPHRSTKNLVPFMPISPLQNRVPNDSPSTRRDTNAQTAVHPLPLPPGASGSVSSPPGVQVTPKAELMPVKEQWQKGRLIGRGTFGSVYVASNRETGALCAMKEVDILPDDAKSAECIKQLEQEIKVLSHLKHPNIVQYYGSEIVGDKFYIYLEYVHPGSINKFIRDHCGAITEAVVRNFTRHIVCGLAYLHSTRTIHRDIKGANLLVDAYGVVKLADFGMAKHLTGQLADLSLKGSPYWMAPELLQSVMQKDTSSDLALAVDIWSLGCTVIEMLNGKPPWSEFEGPAALFKVLRESPTIPETLSAEGKDFLRRCFRRNPAERPTASMLLEHRFLKITPPTDNFPNVDSSSGLKLTEMRS